MDQRADLLQGTLELMILKTLSLEPLRLDEEPGRIGKNQQCDEPEIPPWHDVVLHPQFAQNHLLYLTYHKPTSDGAGAATSSGALSK